VSTLRGTDPTTLAVMVEQQIRETVQQLTETLAAMRAEAAQADVDLAKYACAPPAPCPVTRHPLPGPSKRHAPHRAIVITVRMVRVHTTTSEQLAQDEHAAIEAALAAKLATLRAETLSSGRSSASSLS